MKKTRMLAAVGLAFVLWLSATPRPAFGQGETWPGTSLSRLVESARWRLGALRVNAALELKEAGYETDIYFGFYDEPVPDYTFSASAPVQVLLPVNRNVVLEVSDSPEYVFYLDTERERAWNNTFRGQVHLALQRFYIQAGSELANVRRRMSPELNINIREKTQSLDGLVFWQASRSTSFALIYGGGTFDYAGAEFGETDIADALNRREDYVDVVGYIQPYSRARFYLDGQVGIYNFRADASKIKDSRSFGILGGLDFVPKEEDIDRIGAITGSASLGYMIFDVLDPTQIDGSGIIGDIRLSTLVMRLTTARVVFARSFQLSAYSGATFYLDTSYGAGITRFFSRRISLSYDLSFGRTDYPEIEPGSAPPLIPYRYTTHSAGLTFKAARSLTITLLGTVGRRTTGGTGDVRNRNFIGLSLSYGAGAGKVTLPEGGLGR